MRRENVGCLRADGGRYFFLNPDTSCREWRGGLKKS